MTDQSLDTALKAIGSRQWPGTSHNPKFEEFMMTESSSKRPQRHGRTALLVGLGLLLTAGTVVGAVAISEPRPDGSTLQFLIWSLQSPEERQPADHATQVRMTLRVLGVEQTDSVQGQVAPLPDGGQVDPSAPAPSIPEDGEGGQQEPEEPGE